MKMIVKKIVNFFNVEKESVRFQMDEWYDWHKYPQSFHEGAVDYLTKEGKTVETISVAEQVKDHEISTLLVDGRMYKLTVDHTPSVGILQTAVLIPID